MEDQGSSWPLQKVAEKVPLFGEGMNWRRWEVETGDS